MSDVSLSGANKYLVILHDVAKQNDITNYEIRFNRSGPGVNGYICSIIEAEIISQDEKLSLVIKKCASNDKVRNIAPIASMFKGETYMYKVILPLFEQFVTQHGKNWSKFGPKYYNTYNNNEYDALVLNNLKSEGFVLHNREEFLDENHVKIGLENYAKLHAISLAYRDQKPVEFKGITGKMEDLFLCYIKDGGFIEMFKMQLAKPADLLEAELNKEVLNLFKKFILDVEDYLVNMPSMTDEFSVITHGDSWKNNMLFKYDERNGSKTPFGIRLIDFQFSRYTSPMLDIASFLYGCSSKEIIDNVFQYMDFYYESLCKNVKALGSYPEKLYPHSVMMDHWKKFGRFGLIVRVGAICVVLSSHDDDRKGISDTLEEDGNVSNLFDYKISDLEKFKDLNKHAIEHLVQYHLV